MSTKKKSKLSLKKHSPSKPGGGKQNANTILSMFKKQKEKQVIDIDNEADLETDPIRDPIRDPDETLIRDSVRDTFRESQSDTTGEPGSEGDVVITKVESVGSCSSLKSSACKSEVKALTDSKPKLSLSRGKKRKSEGLSEDEFKPSKSKYFSKNSSSDNDSPSRYNLRKSKTYPVIDLSDSEEAVEPVTVSGDEKKISKSRTKLSLKKNKTDGDEPTQSERHLKQSPEEMSIDERKGDDDDDEKSEKKTIQAKSERKSLRKNTDRCQVKKEHQNIENVIKTPVDDTKCSDLVEKESNNSVDKESATSEIKVKRTESSKTRKKVVITIQDSQSPEKNDKVGKPVETYSIFKPQNLTRDSTKDHSESKTSAAVKKNPLKSKLSTKQKSVPPVISDSLGENNAGADDLKSDIVEKGDEVTEEAEPVFKVPYYLENFRTILDTVLSDKENSRLFSETDMKYVTAFNGLEEPAQKLYVRLFSRLLAWLPMTKINYPEISDDIEGLTDTLTGAGFLISGEELNDVTQILKILAAPDLKALAKSFHLNITGATKKQIVELLLKKSQQSSISSMFTGGGAVSTEKTMVTRAKSSLGRICHLQIESRAVFIRVLMLFSLYHTNIDEESGQGGQNQLFQMLMANIGRVVYPSYTVNRQRSVFKDRDAVIRFETALMCELEIQTITEKNKWTEAFEVYKQAKDIGREICTNKELLDWDLSLPLFLRCYSAGTIYTRIDNQGVEILQRLKKYKEAVELLEELLSQAVYCPEYRGHWYDRLALNLDAHLKMQKKCLEVVKAGLSDPEVRQSRRFLLYQRAEKICTGPNSKFPDKLAEIEVVKVTEAPELYVDGMVMPDATSMGMKYQFVLSGGEEGVTLCAVEELALEHYKENGYPEGLHAEGSIISNLFVLFFWDIEFMDIPDVFHSPFQSAPLDMMTTDFYTSRQQLVDDRLEWLKTADEESLTAEVGDIWEKHNGKMCNGINWEKFAGPQKLQGLVRCMGGKVIAGILERYVKDPRHTRSGFPDLTLWNTENKTFKISEVKGPGDRLSHKQILWLHYLLGLGVDAEVCYVKAVGSKKLKPVARKP